MLPSKYLLHTTLLIAATAGVYLFGSIPTLSSYTLQLVAILVLVYAGSHWLRPTQRSMAYHPRSTISLDLTLLTTMILLLIGATGSLTSPFFFLLYFLLFAVALLFEIEATLTLTAVLILYFLILPSTNLSDLAHLSSLAALLMITPLAIYTGHQKETIFEKDRLAKSLEGHLGQQETDILTFLSLNLKSTLVSSLDKLTLVIPKTQVKEVRRSLELLYQDLRNLYRSADELEHIVDQETDDS